MEDGAIFHPKAIPLICLVNLISKESDQLEGIGCYDNLAETEVALADCGATIAGDGDDSGVAVSRNAWWEIIPTTGKVPGTHSNQPH